MTTNDNSGLAAAEGMQELLPLSYRPHEHDDWGVLKAANGWVFCQVRWPRTLTVDEENEHRRSGTDPYEKAARLVMDAVNYYTRATPPTPTDLEAGGKFKRGDRVRKIRGSSWKGLVVGFYSTDLTPIGYAVESDTEKGSVQIYPEVALELVEAGEPFLRGDAPPGMVMVPIEPPSDGLSFAALDAGLKVVSGEGGYCTISVPELRALYRAIIAAAPKDGGST